MSEKTTTPFINTEDGKVKLAQDQRQAKDLLADLRFKLFPQYWENPDKLYYYEFDGNLNKQLGQEIKPISTTVNEEEVLEVIQL